MKWLEIKCTWICYTANSRKKEWRNIKFMTRSAAKQNFINEHRWELPMLALRKRWQVPLLACFSFFYRLRSPACIYHIFCTDFCVASLHTGPRLFYFVHRILWRSRSESWNPREGSGRSSYYIHDMHRNRMLHRKLKKERRRIKLNQIPTVGRMELEQEHVYSQEAKVKKSIVKTLRITWIY